ncbi:endonuclease/exonuclease/phosphatase family protein [Shewanella gaetbuli]|uniref:Endonuclease/exonuclease/phosphatase domain-containing protein n=1 Tax=Shewanella gaetbuli TaxID=220752 RepID=A0A9X1ZNP5_9GAMM|nr:hypothetical protein [Shewanella gaetbuli]MCL1142810.1 hypothetical protein [Shewanella gaetbuli]
MTNMLLNHKKHPHRTRMASPLIGCLTVALSCFSQLAVSAHLEEGELRLLTLNTWKDRFAGGPLVHDFYYNGNYDVILTQENQGRRYINNIRNYLNATQNSLGYYNNNYLGTNGITSRLKGIHESIPMMFNLRRYLNEPHVLRHNLWLPQFITYETDQLPPTTIASVHLNHLVNPKADYYYWFNEPKDARVKQAKALNKWAEKYNAPIIVGGDFNAGDVSERGIPFDQTYPADGSIRGKKDNTPYTFNILKKQFELLQTEQDRELFTHHPAGNERTTWPSRSEEKLLSRYKNWSRVKLDHFIASRPFAKWWAVNNDENDQYLGVLNQTGVASNGISLSDHQAVAHSIKWIGPKIKRYNSTKFSVTFDFEQFGYAPYNFTRNNQRDDIYIGQLADKEGVPILHQLPEDQKKQLFQCSTDTPTLSSFINEYCIDDHRFIAQTRLNGEVLITVDEQDVFGDNNAQIILSNGATLQLTQGANNNEITFYKKFLIEGNTANVIDIDEHLIATFPESHSVQGDGDLVKNGQGHLVINSNRYSVDTIVRNGAVVVNSTINQGTAIRVEAGATLKGYGKLSHVELNSSAILSPGNNSLARLDIMDGLYIENGAIVKVDITTHGESDQIVSTNTSIDLNNAILSINLNDDEARLTGEVSYNIIQSDQHIVGQFSSVETNLKNSSVEVEYTNNSVTLILNKGIL